MRQSFRLLSLLLAAAAFPIFHLAAEPVAVRHPQGTAHGFLVLRTIAGKSIALGDLTQIVHGDRIVSRLVFRFRDGSLDDDQAVYTQHKYFQLISDHHIQRGPSFPKPLDLSMDVGQGKVVSRERGSDGADKVSTKQMALTPDLANGMFLVLLTNITPTAAATDLPLLVAHDGFRVVHLIVTPTGMVPFSVGGSQRKAREFEIKTDLGGMTGLIAPLIGKQPENAHVLLLEGEAPAFVREEGQLYADGPIWRIDQIGPVTQ
jgi:hypothetical protein